MARSEMTVEVDRQELLDTLYTNRDNHRETFEAAQEEYRKRVISTLEANLKAARNRGEIRTYIRLPEPEDHTEDYNRAIDMMEMDVRDTVPLSATDFDRYVRDRWEWRQSFVANTVSYVSEGGKLPNSEGD